MEEQVKNKVKSVFGKNADKYVTSDIHAKGDDLPLLAEWLHPEKTWTILDIATGGGHVSRVLAPRVGTVVSTDLTEAMLENTAKHLQKDFDNILYVVADAEALPFLADSFDAAVCRIAPHHFPHPEKFIQETARVLKPGGKLILIDNVAPEDAELGIFMNTTEKLRDDSHARCLSKREWRKLLEANALEEIQSLDRKKTFKYPTWVRRTADSEEQIERVTRHLLEADGAAKDYFKIAVQNGEIQTFEIDEWMVMYQK
ncbi:class I SAM-dependent methyltransferase [Planococcus shenhongbingii]|uniref:Methyltransferase domain-containing protein n=1 Tax=Planococcus shenhongbingii TaxID=3058398 RepID=A0ABT8NAN3_9BACL|nr:class I SAM-dependent methyltransferase [Planococcus sp. N017]MDN7244951.1 methyltransferase domain-containing protein [Planococcus sp. N017]